MRSILRLTAVALATLLLSGCASARLAIPGRANASARITPPGMMRMADRANESAAKAAKETPRRTPTVRSNSRPTAQRPAPEMTLRTPLRNVSHGSRDIRPYGNRDISRWIAHEDRLFHPAAESRHWQYIVLHHSAADEGSFGSIDRYHRETKGWDECGYHFVIGNGTESGDGEIEVGGRWTHQKHGAHTKHLEHLEYNERGIGICLVGDFERHAPTPKQIAAARDLVAFLQQRYGVPDSNVTTHGELLGNRTECPGTHFPLDAIVAASGRYASR